MSNSFNLSEVIEHVKNIVDGVRCFGCDKIEGGRVRYPCGHSTCDDCMTVSEDCLRCLTPTNTSGKKPVVDETLSQQAKNAYWLLNICQDTFNLDVYRKIRVSEQLRAEKVLFPQCIQAPVKYYNKRKSLPSERNKENISLSIYPGETVSLSESFKMADRNNYIQQWLTSSESLPRKALSDLNVNGLRNRNSTLKSTIKNHPTKQSKTNIINKKSIRRRNTNNLFASLSDSRFKLGLSSKKTKITNLDISESHVNKKTIGKNENDESGIVLDFEPILIEDSQSQAVDKDALALQAVQAADDEQHQHQHCSISTASLDDTEKVATLALAKNNMNSEYSGEMNKHVPFYKKDCLAKSCFYCNQIGNNEIKSDSRNVLITIDSKSFTATINISNLTENSHKTNSTHVQTDLSDIENVSNTQVGEQNILNPGTKTIHSQDLGTNVIERKLNVDDNAQKPDYMKRGLQSPNLFDLFNDVPNKKRCIVIDDSDSDKSSVEVSLLHISADVHQSCDLLDYGILAEIDTNLPSRSRNKARGVTPDSNNSSDKENRDPNKIKKINNAKKTKGAKKL